MTIQKPQVSLGIREIRRRDLIRSIREVALRMFTERGYDETTLEDVCAEVGVSLRTFFRHFDGKAALITSITRELETGVSARVSAAPESCSFVEAFETAFDLALGEYLHNDPAFARRQLEILIAAPAALTAHWVGEDSDTDPMEVEVARRVGLAVDDPRVRLLRGFVSMAMLDAIARWSANPTENSVVTLATANLEMAKALEASISAK